MLCRLILFKEKHGLPPLEIKLLLLFRAGVSSFCQISKAFVYNFAMTLQTQLHHAAFAASKQSAGDPSH